MKLDKNKKKQSRNLSSAPSGRVTRNDRKRLSKSRYSTTFQLRFVNTEKSFVNMCGIAKKDLSISGLLKERALVLKQINRRYGCLKLGVL